MKRKILTLLLSAAVFTFAGCGDIGVTSGPDGSLTVVAGGSEFTIGGEDPVQEILPEEDPDLLDLEDSEIPVSEDTGSNELTGTSNGGEDLYQDPAPELEEDGTYDHLPDNYITKSEARDLGWTGGSVERYAPGCAIGGDRFGNREGLLPSEDGRTYYECDIDTIGETSRGAKRIIFSNDGLIYYTEDHYESFTLLYGEE